MTGLRLAVSLLTVLPVGHRGPVDRTHGRAMLAWAPVVGCGLGLLAAGVLAGADLLWAPSLVAGLLTVAALTLATRALHLDGLADCADGLGCYGDAQRALDVMRQGGVGPFGVVALVLVIGAQAGSLGAIAAQQRWWAVVVAVAAGRVAFGWCCRRGTRAARPDGLGALVAGSQRLATVLGWAAVALAAGAFAVPDRWWQGVLAVAVAGAAVVALSAHTGRRFGGVTGDVLGAACELATTVVLVGCAFG